jgi:hypothetical protein
MKAELLANATKSSIPESRALANEIFCLGGNIAGRLLQLMVDDDR